MNILIARKLNRITPKVLEVDEARQVNWQAVIVGK